MIHRLYYKLFFDNFIKLANEADDLHFALGIPQSG